MDGGGDPSTEILGFESVMEKIDGGDFPVSSGTWEERESANRRGKKSEGTKKVSLKCFPPLLTILSEDGRPRFDFVKLTDDNGRLTISMVRNDKKTILRCRRSDGHLTMCLVRSDGCDSDDDQCDLDKAGDDDDDRGMVQEAMGIN